MPKTSIQQKSIIRRLQKIDNRQKDIRMLLKLVDDMPLKKNTILKSLNIKKDRLEVTIGLSKQKDQKALENYLSKRANIEQQEYNGLDYKVTLSHG